MVNPSREVTDVSAALTGKFVGVIPIEAFQNIGHLKRLLLMFDSVALDLGRSVPSLVERRILSTARSDMQWLSSQGLLTTLAGLVANSNITSFRGPQVSVMGDVAPLGNRSLRLIGRAANLAVVATTGLRVTASDLRSIYGIDAVAVPTGLEAENADAVADRDAVIRISLREFPFPSEATSWDVINNFRRDEAARAQFHRLKQWINKTGKAVLKEYEVSDELRELLNEYEEGMRLHKIKAQQGIVEVLVTTTADVAEGILKLKWSDAAKSIFNVRNHKIKLLEEERAAKGREVAYIVTARGKFKAS